MNDSYLRRSKRICGSLHLPAASTQKPQSTTNSHLPPVQPFSHKPRRVSAAVTTSTKKRLRGYGKSFQKSTPKSTSKFTFESPEPVAVPRSISKPENQSITSETHNPTIHQTIGKDPPPGLHKFRLRAEFRQKPSTQVLPSSPPEASINFSTPNRPTFPQNTHTDDTDKTVDYKWPHTR